MQRKHKLVIVVASTAVGLVIFGSVVFFAIWFRTAKSNAAAARAEGTAYAERHDADQCVSEALGRLSRPGLKNEAAAQAFLRACLAAAPRSASFCAAVPAKGEIMAGAFFGLRFCEQRGRAGDQRCGRSIAQVLPEACSAPAPSARP